MLAYRFQGGWVRGICPAIADKLLRPCLEGRQVLMCREENGSFRLAFPLRAQQPFPLPMLFCLGRPERVEGDVCVVYRFDPQGRPCCEETCCCTGEIVV